MKTSGISPEKTELFRQLSSENPGIAQKSLHRLLKIAGLKEMPLLIRIMAVTRHEKVTQDIENWLASIKTNEAAVIMAEALVDPDLSSIRAALVRASWESQLDFSHHLLLFAHLMITGDYGLAVEAFSVIENTCMEHPVPVERINELTSQLKNSLPDQPESKQRLVRELILVLENCNR